MKKLMTAVGAALIAAAALPLPASAASFLITGTWSGVTTGGSDQFGEFGSPTSQIAAGLPVSGEISIRTSGLEVQSVDDGWNLGLNATDSSHFGDIIFSIALNGDSKTVSSTALGAYSVMQDNAGYYPKLSQEFFIEPSSIQRKDVNGQLIEANNVEFGVGSGMPFLDLGHLNQSFSYSANPDPIGGFYGHWDLDQNGFVTKSTQIDFVANSLNVNSVSMVPEPETWAFLIVGVAAVGASLRSRRKPAAAV
jgi:hypothetical protein